MATSSNGPTLLSIPLELRHTIFEAAATRPNGPKKILRRWFEKKEVKELIAKQMASNPDGVTPRAVYPKDNSGEESDREVELEEDDSEEEDEDQAQQDEEDEDEDDMDEENEDQDAEDHEAEDNGDDMDDVQEADEEEAMDEDGVGNANGGVTAANGETQEDRDASEHEDEPMDADTEGHVDGEHIVVDGDASERQDEYVKPSFSYQLRRANGTPRREDETTSDNGGDNVDGEHIAEANAGEEETAESDDMAIDGDGDDSTATTTQNTLPPPPPPPQPAPIVRPHTKWRHIPKFLRISHNPPPRELFLVSKQLNQEAKDWFYDIAIIRIDATGSFQHTSMFEESLQQIVDAAFSPFENIRKVEIKFVWDTEWMRSQDWVEGVFQALLRQRALFVLNILKAAPELNEIVIHWHDSINDDDSSILKLEIAEGFLSLPANVKLEEHYLRPGTKPHRKSIAGRKRLEFQRIVDEGMNLN